MAEDLSKGQITITVCQKHVTFLEKKKKTKKNLDNTDMACHSLNQNPRRLKLLFLFGLVPRETA